jgi:hypothetical protein
MTIILQYMTIISHYMTIISHYMTIILQYMTIISHYMTIISQYMTIISHYMTIISHYMTSPACHAQSIVRSGTTPTVCGVALTSRGKYTLNLRSENSMVKYKVSKLNSRNPLK